MTEFPIDFAALVPDTRPRRWLVLPEGFQAVAAPDEQSPVFEASPAETLDAVIAVAMAEPKVHLLGRKGLQAALVQRTKVFGFADDVTVQAFPAGPGRSVLAVYSRARVGRYDFGVNRKRVRRWLQAARERLAQAEGSAK
jgi:uncharacterized protein (DUF1499 family)